MQKVLINLDRSTERLETFYRVNKHIEGVERFSAIEGKGLRQPLKRSGMLLDGVEYTDGALGCALSHAEQWRCAISSGGGRTIIEDDAVFCKNFEEEHQRLLKALPETWDIVLWGFTWDTVLSYQMVPELSYNVTIFNQESLRKNIDLWPERCVTGILFKLHKVWGTVCYTISPKGAKKLLDFCFPIRPLFTGFPLSNFILPNTGIDVAMLNLYSEIEAYICIPPLVVTPNYKGTSQTHNS